jgi:hypothetical protein
MELGDSAEKHAAASTSCRRSSSSCWRRSAARWPRCRRPTRAARRHAAESEQEERRRQLLRLLAEIEKRVNEENARPKKRYISPATREEVYALYYDACAAGRRARHARLPGTNGRKLYGELTMNVTVDAAGRVVEAEIVRRSLRGGWTSRRWPSCTRLALRRLLTGHAPQADQIVVTSRFRFTREDGLETQISRTDERRPPLRRPGQPGGAQPQPLHPRRLRAPDRPGHRLRPHVVPMDGFAAAVQAFAAAGGRGCNVTVPFKFEAPALARHCSDRAQLAGAANVLRFDAEGWLPTTPTAPAWCATSNRRRRAAGRPAVCCWWAPAAPVPACWARLLGAAPVEVVVANRTLDKARRWSPPCRAGGRPGRGPAPATWPRPAWLSTCHQRQRQQPAGAPSPVPAAPCWAGTLAVDLMYGPAAEPFLAWARSPRCGGPRRPGHAGGAGRRGLCAVARRAPADAPVLQALRAEMAAGR